jgi:hypothetical protein
MGKSIVTKDILREVFDRLADGESLTSICQNDPKLPHYKTIIRYCQRHQETWDEYQQNREIADALLKDRIIDMCNAPLPDDPKAADVEVRWRKVRMDALDKQQRQLRPLGGVKSRADEPKGGQQIMISCSWVNPGDTPMKVVNGE